jgi:hypothetical protein
MNEEIVQELQLPQSPDLAMKAEGTVATPTCLREARHFPPQAINVNILEAACRVTRSEN